MDEKFKFLKALVEKMQEVAPDEESKANLQTSLDMIEAANNPTPLTPAENKQAEEFLIDVLRYAKRAGDPVLAIGYALNARMAKIEALFTGRTLN